MDEAQRLMISATRKIQGAASRRRTTSQALFDACAEIRRRIKSRYRGGRHAALRRAFGEGLAASPAKPETIVVFADVVLAAAAQHGDELREVQVLPPSLARVTRLAAKLRAYPEERAGLRQARKALRKGDLPEVRS